MKQAPIEYWQAKKAVDEAWKKYYKLISDYEVTGKQEYFELSQEMMTAAELLEERKTSIYNQWQILGGTSDIKSIALLPHELLVSTTDGCGNDEADILAGMRG